MSGSLGGMWQLIGRSWLVGEGSRIGVQTLGPAQEFLQNHHQGRGRGAAREDHPPEELAYFTLQQLDPPTEPLDVLVDSDCNRAGRLTVVAERRDASLL